MNAGPKNPVRAPLVFFLLIFALGGAASAAQGTGTTMAPFGLNWGMSSDQVRALGIELAEMNDKSLGGQLHRDQAAQGSRA